MGNLKQKTYLLKKIICNIINSAQIYYLKENLKVFFGERKRNQLKIRGLQFTTFSFLGVTNLTFINFKQIVMSSGGRTFWGP